MISSNLGRGGFSLRYFLWHDSPAAVQVEQKKGGGGDRLIRHNHKSNGRRRRLVTTPQLYSRFISGKTESIVDVLVAPTHSLYARTKKGIHHRISSSPCHLVGVLQLALSVLVTFGLAHFIISNCCVPIISATHWGRLMCIPRSLYAQSAWIEKVLEMSSQHFWHMFNYY